MVNYFLFIAFLATSIFTKKQDVTTASVFENHPLYVSITQINQNSKSKTIEVAIKVFTEDLEKAVSSSNQSLSLHLNSSKEIKNADDLIKAYLVKSLQIHINKKPMNLKWIGKEYEKDDATWCYFEIPYQGKIKTVWVNNTILTEIFIRQNNMVQVQTDKGKKSLLLYKDNSSGLLNF